MPYPRAHYYVLSVIAVIILGFWPSYLSVWGTVPWQFHAHGIAASCWVTMVAAQSWTAHHKQLAIHRVIGRSSLFLFPFLIGGLAAIIDVTGQGFVAGGDPVRTIYGGSFLIGIAVAMAAYVTVYYRALKYRRKVWEHSAYLLSTPLILFESPFSRVLTLYVPGFIIRGPADFQHLMPSIMCSMALELCIIGVIWLKFRDKAMPFLVAGAFIAVEMLAMTVMAHSTALNGILTIIGRAPSAAVVATGFAIGAVTSWAGWNGGKRSATSAMGAVQPV